MFNWNCYICVLSVKTGIELRIRNRDIRLQPGVYLYIGSSRKPGLVYSRIARHIVRDKKKHWHIDHLTASSDADVHGFLLVKSNHCDCEKLLTFLLVDNGYQYVPGFGSSDKPLEPSHLFYCPHDVLACLFHVYSLLDTYSEISEVVYVEINE